MLPAGLRIWSVGLGGASGGLVAVGGSGLPSVGLGGGGRRLEWRWSATGVPTVGEVDSRVGVTGKRRNAVGKRLAAAAAADS
ncbi:unnamed protein product [Linum trigynum]|uniref:Secreted protein n=1 Tax=Linum trigynum TaxID=586398 RepID=A0AAV2DN66_9ROSI